MSVGGGQGRSCVRERENEEDGQEPSWGQTRGGGGGRTNGTLVGPDTLSLRLAQCTPIHTNAPLLTTVNDSHTNLGSDQGRTQNTICLSSKDWRLVRPFVVCPLAGVRRL